MSADEQRSFDLFYRLDLQGCEQQKTSGDSVVVAFGTDVHRFFEGTVETGIVHEEREEIREIVDEVMKIISLNNTDTRRWSGYYDSDPKPQAGERPLHTLLKRRRDCTDRAQRDHNLVMIKLLLDAKADCNTNSGKKNCQFTSLHFAAEQDDEEVVKLLLQHGANPLITNGFDHCALSLAQKKEVKQLLAVKLPAKKN